MYVIEISSNYLPSFLEPALVDPTEPTFTYQAFLSEVLRGCGELPKCEGLGCNVVAAIFFRYVMFSVVIGVVVVIVVTCCPSFTMIFCITMTKQRHREDQPMKGSTNFEQRNVSNDQDLLEEDHSSCLLPTKYVLVDKPTGNISSTGQKI